MHIHVHVQSAAQPNYMKTKYSLDKTKPLPYTRTLNYARLNYGMEGLGVNNNEGKTLGNSILIARDQIDQ